MGIRIDDKSINGFYDALTNQSIGRDGMLEILRHVRQGASEASFIAILARGTARHSVSAVVPPVAG